MFWTIGPHQGSEKQNKSSWDPKAVKCSFSYMWRAWIAFLLLKYSFSFFPRSPDTIFMPPQQRQPWPEALCLQSVYISINQAIHPILVKALKEMSIWTRGWTDYNLVAKGWRSMSLWPRKTHFGHNSIIHIFNIIKFDIHTSYSIKLDLIFKRSESQSTVRS